MIDKISDPPIPAQPRRFGDEPGQRSRGSLWGARYVPHSGGLVSGAHVEDGRPEDAHQSRRSVAPPGSSARGPHRAICVSLARRRGTR